MLLKYVGDGRQVSFVYEHFYKARKTDDQLGEGYAIFDEGDDWYWYGAEFVEKNFEIVSSDSEIVTAESVAV